jgi:hypothetical protein
MTNAAAGRPAPYRHEHDISPSGALIAGIVMVLGLVIVAFLIMMMSQSSNDSTYLAKMHSSPYGTHDNTDLELIRMAHNVCGAFDNGRTVKQIADSFWGMSVRQRGWLMGAGVSVYCPEHQNTMIGELNAYNGY